MGSTEHEDSGMEDILDSIRRIISDEPLDNELPQVVHAAGHPAGPAVPNAMGQTSIAGVPGADGMRPGQLPRAHNSAPTNSAPIAPAPTSPMPTNNGNVASQLANALENNTQPSPPAPTVATGTVAPIAGETTVPLNASLSAPLNAPVQTNGVNPAGATNTSDIMELTQPVAMPAVPTTDQLNGANPAAPNQPAFTAPAVPSNGATPPHPPIGATTPTPIPARAGTATNLRPPQPMPMRTPVGEPPVAPPQAPAEPITQASPVAEPTSHQFNGAPMNGSAEQVDIAPNGAAQSLSTQPLSTLSPHLASPTPPSPVPEVARQVSSDNTQDAGLSPNASNPVVQAGAEPGPKSTGINALNNALVGVSVAVPQNQKTQATDEDEMTSQVQQAEDQTVATTAKVDAQPEISALDGDQKPSPTEQAMRNLLKPMIKAWLDENMPRMVEEVLRDEVRLAAKSDD